MRVCPPFEAVSKSRAALGRDALFILDELRRGICIAVETDNGVSILRNEKPELVLVSYTGKDMFGAFEFWRKVAYLKGFETIRAHTVKPGVLKIALKHPLVEEAETIVRGPTDGAF